eukprot:GHUV01021912.1.p1 GENE.GHUV01021912.1~~GHUV01021912.1.p1  ORF type:complete len:464 (+),score=88.55 GHUV01021912.1:533-1924(+)
MCPKVCGLRICGRHGLASGHNPHPMPCGLMHQPCGNNVWPEARTVWNTAGLAMVPPGSLSIQVVGLCASQLRMFAMAYLALGLSIANSCRCCNATTYAAKPSATALRFAETPMEDLSLETVCAIFDWPGFLQDAEPFKGVTAKAWSKLLEMFGDLEVAWQDRSRRQQFLELPYKAVRKLIASDDVAVSSENTILVALAEWVEASNRRQLTTDVTALLLGPQHGTSHRELAELVRLQHLTPTFLGSVLKHVSIMNQVATAEALQAAARYATGNEATRNKLHNMPNRQPRFKVLYSPPRARSVVQRLEFTWVLELQTVKAMIDQFRNTKVTVDRYSEPHYFNGFQWQLVLQVLEPPAKQPAAGQAAVSTPAAAVDVFVGTTARIQIGGSQHLPDVLYFQGQLAAREVASGDFTFVNRMESGFVCGTAGWGFRNFLRITDWDNEAALRRFFYDGKIHLRCNIDQCE